MYSAWPGRLKGMGDLSVDALLVELPVKLVCRRSQVRFLLTGFHARCVDFIRYKFRCAAGRLKSAAVNVNNTQYYDRYKE